MVATPIGNLKDIGLRALEVLEGADIIAAEDTRNTIKLLNHYKISKPLISYHEHNKIERAYKIIEEVRGGKKVALVTDAGMPAISDPGEDLVRIAYEEGIEVSVIPGASACLSALALSGLPTSSFIFQGFLPREKKSRMEILEELEREYRTIIIYEAPHRLIKTLEELVALFGKDRKVALVRELTKKHEEVIRGELKTVVYEYVEQIRIPKGEYVIVLAGRSRIKDREQKRREWNKLSIEEHMAFYIDRGADRKEAMRKVAKDRGKSKRDIYNALIER